MREAAGPRKVTGESYVFAHDGQRRPEHPLGGGQMNKKVIATLAIMLASRTAALADASDGKV